MYGIFWVRTLQYYLLVSSEESKNKTYTVRQRYVQELLIVKAKVLIPGPTSTHLNAQNLFSLLISTPPPPPPPPHLLLSTEADFNNNSIKSTVSKAGHDYMKTAPFSCKHFLFLFLSFQCFSKIYSKVHCHYCNRALFPFVHYTFFRAFQFCSG
jgi:hypothetical protein